MVKKKTTTIDALFGSKTRVKLLYLFLNNPGKAFYVREITRLIDEQINSVRRELSNLLGVGVITSDTADNKLYYEVNKSYEHYTPFRSMFTGVKATNKSSSKAANSQISEAKSDQAWRSLIQNCKGLRLVVCGGILVEGSASNIDLLLVGSITPAKTKSIVKAIESNEGRELNYSLMSYDEFYYRLSVRDRFITEVISSKYEVILDTDNVLNSQK